MLLCFYIKAMEETAMNKIGNNLDSIFDLQKNGLQNKEELMSLLKYLNLCVVHICLKYLEKSP